MGIFFGIKLYEFKHLDKMSSTNSIVQFYLLQQQTNAVKYVKKIHVHVYEMNTNNTGLMPWPGQMKGKRPCTRPAQTDQHLKKKYIVEQSI